MRGSIIAILAFLGSANLLSAGVAPSLVPQLVVEERAHDFSNANLGDHLAADFVLKNAGGATLRIISVTPDCACVTAEYDKTIEPGASGHVRVAFDTTDKVGILVQVVTVETNDPAMPALELKLSARVPPFLILHPGYARYLYVQKEVPGTIRQVIGARDGKEFNILSVKSPYPFLAVSFREATAEERRDSEPGKQWVVETTLSPDAPVGAISGSVEVITDHPKQKTARFDVSGFVRPVLAVTPESADFGDVKLGQGKIGTFRVQCFATEEIVLSSVDTNVKGLTAEIETLKPGHDYLVHLRLTAEVKKGPFHGALRLHTASPKVAVVDVPVSGSVL